ncbi:MAG: class I SAM-dependent methyltransferase [Spiribacter sp.]|nr:class I SAM-dependent methyltransferase [Spiribacter sp.]MDR9488766.1 class I SAM-dependent methyltransferase [Spiribacter sp.]
MLDTQVPTRPEALKLGDRLGLEVRAQIPTNALYLQPGPPAITLCQAARPARCIAVNFTRGRQAYRYRQLGHQREAIARACGLGQSARLRIVDATAGLGRDAFVLAALGAEVSLLERSPVLHVMLEDGMNRALADGLSDPIGRMELQQCDAREWLAAMPITSVPDVVYLDPMYTGSRRAAAGKELALLSALLGPGDDADALLMAALNAATTRVVVKRQRRAPTLMGREPDYQLTGRSTRFDIYKTKKARPR